MLKIIKNYGVWLSRKLNIAANLTAENFALRQQLIVLKRNQRRPKLNARDRLFWVLMSHIWSGWRDVLLIVQQETVIRWHKTAFKSYWHRKSQAGKRGRPGMDADVKALILKMADANPLWGAPKIQANCSNWAS